MLLQLIGRLHILILHLPIGILLLTFVLEWTNHWKFVVIPRKVLTLNYGLGSTAIILSCVSGYILSESGDYGKETINNHMWMGIVAAVITVVLFWNSYKEYHNNARWGAVVLALAIIVTGHLGGTITHGEGFFSDFSSDHAENDKGPVFEIQNVEEALLYNDLIKPILQAKCVRCHGTSKKKGKLSLDKKETIIKGGKSGKSLVGVEPEMSEMIRRIQLPMSEEEHMPPKKYQQITMEELQLIKWWLKKGSSFDKKVTELSTEDSVVYELIDKIIENSKSEDLNVHSDFIPAKLPEIHLELPSLQDLINLKEVDIVALKAGKESPFLEINLVNVAEMNSNHWAMLSKISPHIVRLKLSGKNVEDKDLSSISKMQNLLWLYLDNTNITDDGLHFLSNLSLLQYLNLNNTAVTDEGLKSLGRMSNLKVVYAYQTAVTTSHLSDRVKVEKGGFQLPMLETDTLRIK